jgi:hypothetical protein
MTKSAFDLTKIVESASPSLAPRLNEILRDADVLLELMGREPLDVVADLANTLRASAHDAGAWEIEAAANDVRRVVSGGSPVALTGAIYALTDAITRTEQKRAA